MACIDVELEAPQLEHLQSSGGSRSVLQGTLESGKSVLSVTSRRGLVDSGERT